MIQEIRITSDFNDWRDKARILLNSETPPQKVRFESAQEAQESLQGIFSAVDLSEESTSSLNRKYVVSQIFLDQAKIVFAHRDEQKWNLMYQLLWRLTHGEPELLRNTIDPDVKLFNTMYRSVRRDMHKMTAFVRFREVNTKDFDGKGESWFVAWYEPDHLILKLTSQFFLDRFNGMNFSILTPDGSLYWNQERATFGPGCSRAQAPSQDDVENLWKTYYASIFNPARIKERAMKKELPVRYWKNLPESELIPHLIRQAPDRLQKFYNNQVPSAERWLPPTENRTLDTLRDSVQRCKACDICKMATQAVFGEGPSAAKIVFVGEQPGDQEDLNGKPFVGPAGVLLDRAFQMAGIDRNQVYLTNAVKHFKWVPRGKLRLHQRPSPSEISACRPWLSAELTLLKPDVLVCLGVSAAQSILGKAVTLKEIRGKEIETAACQRTWITTHPSAILRTPDPVHQDQELSRFVEELKRAVESIHSLHSLDPFFRPCTEVQQTLDPIL